MVKTRIGSCFGYVNVLSMLNYLGETTFMFQKFIIYWQCWTRCAFYSHISHCNVKYAHEKEVVFHVC